MKRQQQYPAWSQNPPKLAQRQSYGVARYVNDEVKTCNACPRWDLSHLPKYA
jgi:hypothetical protein